MIPLADKPNVEAPSGSYNYGKIKDNTGANDGTPVNTLVYSDIHEFFESLMQYGQITANSLPDSDDDGYQLIAAHIASVKRAAAPLLKMAAEALIGNPLSVVSNTAPASLLGLAWNGGSSVMSAGYILYQGELYFCGGYTGVIADTAVFTIIAPNVITVSDAVSGSGTFDYADLIFYQQQRIQTVGGTIYGGVTPAAYSADFSEVAPAIPLRYWKDKDGVVHIQGMAECNTTSGPAIVVFTLPVGYRPIDTILNFVIQESGPFAAAQLEINSSGQVKIYNTTSGKNYSFGTVSFATL